MKLSDFGLCKPLDCSNLQEKDFTVARNVSGALQSDGRPVATRRTQQEQLLNWQRNRRMLVSFTSFLSSGIICKIELTNLGYLVSGLFHSWNS